jgi:hypothetical protein
MYFMIYNLFLGVIIVIQYETHDKILLAGELLVEAAKTYRSGEKNVDFAKSILLAGAVIGIISPCLEENKIEFTQLWRAKIFTKISTLKEKKSNPASSNEQKQKIKEALRFYRLVYNALKHTGHGNTPPSADLYFKANLKEEALYLINTAIDDYNKLPISQTKINTQLPDDLLDLLASHLLP